MATVIFPFVVRNAGVPTAGLTLTWSALRKLSDGTSVASPGTVAPIVELGNGMYKVTYDPESANGELSGIIDAGAGITAAAERYVEFTLAQDSSRVIRSLTGDAFTRLGAPVGASIAADIASVKSDTTVLVDRSATYLLNADAEAGNNTIRLVAGNTAIGIRYVLRDALGRSVPLGGEPVSFSLKLRGESSPAINDVSATVIDAAGGMVEFLFSDTHPVPAAGDYRAQFRVGTAPGGMVFPLGSWIDVTIVADEGA